MTTVVTRAVKGSALTYAEMDANFNNLNTEKAPIDSPVFTGNPTAPTPAAGDNDTSIATTAFVTSLITRKNRLINGGFQINQRGTATLTAANVFGPDRWQAVLSGGTGITATFTNAVNTGWKAGYAGIVAGNWTTGAIRLIQNIESYDCTDLVNENVTITTTVYHNAGVSVNYYLELRSADVKDTYGSTTLIGLSSATLVATATAVTLTYTVNAGAAAAKGLQLQIKTDATTVVGKSFFFGDTQLEKGSSATAFEMSPYGLEWSLCYRFYYRSFPGLAAVLGTSWIASTTNAAGFVTFPVPMRIVPSALEQSGTAGDYSVGATVCTVAPFFAAGSKTIGRVTFTTGATLTAGNGSDIRTTGANGYLGWSAEL